MRMWPRIQFIGLPPGCGCARDSSSLMPCRFVFTTRWQNWDCAAMVSEKAGIGVCGRRGATAPPVLDRLEERGLLHRRPNPADRRSFLLDLTANGRRIAEQVQTFVDALERAIAQKVTKEEEAGFRAVMAAIHAVTEMTLVERKK